MRKETGGSVRIYNLARGLAKAGNNVEVVLPNYQTNHKNVDGIPVHELHGFMPKALLQAVGNQTKIARPSSFYFFDFLFLIRAIPVLHKADIVQVEQPILALLLTPFIQRLLGKPVALDCHDVFQARRVRQTGPVRRILETFLEKVAYRNADLVITVSEKEKQLLISSGVPENKVIVAPNGVDTASFEKKVDAQTIKKRLGFTDCPMVVFLGNLSYLPNQEALQTISSTIAPRVMAEVPNVKFLAIGKIPPGFSPLPHIQFTGFVEDAAEVLATSDVGIAPLHHGSGTRLKILEYLSCGIPVVSTSVGAEGLHVTDGQSIFIADDPQEFAAQITHLLKDPALSLAAGAAGREVAKSYDWKKIAEKLQADYKNFLLEKA